MKYEGLRDYLQDDGEHLISSCLWAIYSMWINYSDFSKGEKAKSGDTVLEMQSFSRKHFHEIIRGDFTKIIKITCILFLNRNNAVMRICFCAGKVFRDIRVREKKMFE